MILCVGTTPAVQRVMVFRGLELGEVNRAVRTLEGAAGKSVNVAKVLQGLGECPLALGFLGGDRGELLRGMLAAAGVESEFLGVRARTRQCLTVIDEGAGRQTELVEESGAVEEGDYGRLLAVLKRRLPGARALVLSGTLAPGGAEDFYAHCLGAVDSARVLTVVDAKGPPLEAALCARPGLVKPNRGELAATVGRELREEASVRAAMIELRARGAQRVVVTAGQGPTLACDAAGFWRITPPRLQAVNPIGSGDSCTAGLVWRLVQGVDLGEACRWGTACGAANALTLMPGEVHRPDVERLAAEVRVERLDA